VTSYLARIIFDKTERCITSNYRNPFLGYALVGESALVLRWQGTNSDLKPVLVTNSHGVSCTGVPSPFFVLIDSTTPIAVLDVKGAIPASGLSSPCGDEPEHFEEFVDVQSGVGLLWVVSFPVPPFRFFDTISTSRIAAEELLRSGYQPSRTLVLSLMLGDVSRHISTRWKNHPRSNDFFRLSPQASDAPKVSQYLHDTYGESGLVMEFELPPLVCKGQRFKGLMLRVFHTLADGVSGAFRALVHTSASSQTDSRPFDAGEPSDVTRDLRTLPRFDSWTNIPIGCRCAASIPFRVRQGHMPRKAYKTPRSNG
jgi:hypothetical protein